MDDEKKKIIINIVVAVLIGGGLFFGVAAILLSLPSQNNQVAAPPQILTIQNPTLFPTSTTAPDEEDVSEENEIIQYEFQIGSVVQIYNTEGAGLRLRSNPGTSSSIQFIGEELELFTVVNGPTEQDGYTWWYLESPYDKTRSGWAAADYLQLIEETDS